MLTQAAFDRLLSWLNQNREEAGQKYETIRRRLIKIFTCRGCHEAEELADETFNRVALKVEWLAENYDGDPALYFYGVAQKIYLEYVRKRPLRPAPPTPPVADEREYDCLESCLERLPAEQRELLLGYYRAEGRAKIDHRKALAEKLGIALNALRIRAHRLRATLQQCVRACMASAAG
jgi:DNA-directed RNA polymerase specialized sigma24 family protein